LDNICVVVRDFDRMVAFYGDTLGLELADNGHRPDKGWAMFSCGNVDVVLLHSDSGEAPQRRSSAYWNNPAGLDSFAFEVDDIDEAMEILDRASIEWAGDLVIYANGEVLDEIPEHVSGIWYRYRSFYDPEGNMLHLTEPHRDGAES